VIDPYTPDQESGWMLVNKEEPAEVMLQPEEEMTWPDSDGAYEVMTSTWPANGTHGLVKKKLEQEVPRRSKIGLRGQPGAPVHIWRHYRLANLQVDREDMVATLSALRLPARKKWLPQAIQNLSLHLSRSESAQLTKQLQAEAGNGLMVDMSREAATATAIELTWEARRTLHLRLDDRPRGPSQKRRCEPEERTTPSDGTYHLITNDLPGGPATKRTERSRSEAPGRAAPTRSQQSMMFTKRMTAQDYKQPEGGITTLESRGHLQGMIRSESDVARLETMGDQVLAETRASGATDHQTGLPQTMLDLGYSPTKTPQSRRGHPPSTGRISRPCTEEESAAATEIVKPIVEELAHTGMEFHDHTITVMQTTRRELLHHDLEPPSERPPEGPDRKATHPPLTILIGLTQNCETTYVVDSSHDHAPGELPHSSNIVELSNTPSKITIRAPSTTYSAAGKSCLSTSVTLTMHAEPAEAAGARQGPWQSRPSLTTTKQPTLVRGIERRIYYQFADQARCWTSSATSKTE
jgi:hypothetical protein